MHGGHSIGTLCAIDRRPRAFTAEQINLLRDLARLIANEIELRRIATADSLTGVLTRRGFDIEINRELKAMSGDNQNLSLIAVDIDHFKPVNDRYGHTVGDLALRTLVARIKQELRVGDFIGRLGGDEFAIALPATDVEGARALAEQVPAAYRRHGGALASQRDPADGQRRHRGLRSRRQQLDRDAGSRGCGAL